MSNSTRTHGPRISTPTKRVGMPMRTVWIIVAALLAVGLTVGGCSKSANPPSNTESSPNNAQPAPNNPQPSPNAQPSATNPSNPSGPETANQAQPAPPPAPKPIVIPAGAVLTVTVDQAVSSKTNNTGDHFDASLAEPVVVNGTVVLRRGTKVSGLVTDAKSAGRFNGQAELGLALDSITVGGKEYRLQTGAVAENSKGRGKRTGIGAGGGAAFGAIVGAIAGGGKGAAIGALAGGGAGGAGAAFTGKRDIEVPPETRLDFKLAEPVTIVRG